ncbi:MAG: serine hydrolase [Bacteroidia bacterium]
MKPLSSCTRQFLLITLIISSIGLFAQTYFPPAASNNEWDTIAPSDLGYCQDSIDALYDFLEDERSKSFILIKDGKIVLEKYFGTFTEDSLFVWFSAGKSLRSMLVGIAQEEGHLNINDKTSDYLGTGWTSLDSNKESLITIKHQLSMSTGLDETEFDCTTPTCLTYKADAGTRWFYHNSPYNLLKDVLESATGRTINYLTNNGVKNKTGMGSGFWLKVGNNTFYFSKARDMARYGLLVQNLGVWDGDTILKDSQYYNQMVNSSQTMNPSYGYLWWLNGKASFIPPGIGTSFNGSLSPNAPSDAIIAAGAQGQFISVVPSKGMIMIRQGWAKQQNLTSILLHDNIWARILRMDCTLSSKEIKADNIEIYPNPATHELRLNSKAPHINDRLVILNSLGQKLLEQAWSNSIDVEFLPPGQYYIHLIKEDGERFYSGSFIKSAL